MDGPDRDTSPFTASEVRQTVEAVHARGARVTAHSLLLPGARAAVAAGVDALEPGFQLDADLAAADGRAGHGAGRDAGGDALMGHPSQQRPGCPGSPRQRGGRCWPSAGRQHTSRSGWRSAAGVLIAAGTDFGGGSLRANQLAWEVQALVAAGLDPYDALAAATVNGGRLLGEPDAGVLTEGGPADFLLVHGDPLSEPGSLWRVWRTSWKAGFLDLRRSVRHLL